MNIRHIRSSDHSVIRSHVDDWWGGRSMSHLLPRLFFDHFQDTSFIVEENGEILAFLIGFISQSSPETAYIHFVGVHPEKRNKGWGRTLYQRFFETIQQKGCHKVECITSPVNQDSIAYHTRLGFAIVPGDQESEEGIWIHPDHDGPGQDRVVFRKELNT